MTISSLVRTVVCVFIVSLSLARCAQHNYSAKAVTPASKFPAAIERAQVAHRYFVLQSGINVYSVTSVEVDQAKQHMTVTLDKVDSIHLLQLRNSAGSNYQTAKAEQRVQPRIHVYLSDSTSYTFDEPHTIPLNKVSRVELID